MLSGSRFDISSPSIFLTKSMKTTELCSQDLCMGFEKAECLGGQKEQAQDAGAEQVWSPSAKAE